MQLSETQIKCFKHAESRTSSKIGGSKKKKKLQPPLHYNIDWCISCSDGGSLICCERCPNSFHISCLGVGVEPAGSFLCSECLSGKPILHGDIVWAKMGSYRYLDKF